MVMEWAFNCSGRTAISYCFNRPPKLLTSATPGVPSSCRLTIQSWMVRSCIASYLCSYPGLGRTTYWYISPNPVVKGASSGEPIPSGMFCRTCCRRSLTCCRAQYPSILSSNTMVTSDKPKREKLRICFSPGILLHDCSKRSCDQAFYVRCSQRRRNRNDLYLVVCNIG